MCITSWQNTYTKRRRIIARFACHTVDTLSKQEVEKRNTSLEWKEREKMAKNGQAEV
jgi:hypothetical protein